MKVRGTLVKSLSQAHQAMKAGQFTPVDLLSTSLASIEEQSNKDLNAFVSYRDQEKLQAEAEAATLRYSEESPLGALDGVPLAIKDNLLVKNIQSSAASNILKGFISPINATSVQRLTDSGALLVGTANMDEFGMGSYGQHGYDGSFVKNPIHQDYFAGGSSAGSAAAVRSSQVLGSLGSDTGGSIGMPAHCCGVVGFKPSYGRVSRFGLIIYSSSSDVNGPLAKSTEDAYHILKSIQGEDQNDSNCIDFSQLNPDTYRDADKRRVLDDSFLASDGDEGLDLKGVKIGVVEEFFVDELDPRNKAIQKSVLEKLEQHGAQIEVISLPLVKYALPFYYSLIPSEAASNLARYDGIRYGQEHDKEDILASAVEDKLSPLFQYIQKTKSNWFGSNVQRRLLIGNFLMSSGGGLEDFNKNLVDAQRYRRMFIQEYCDVMKKHDIDVILSPNYFGEKPQRINDILNQKKEDQKLYEYKMDYYTVVTNTLGVQALTMPVMESSEAAEKYSGFPGSIRLQGYFGEDFHVLRIGNKVEGILKANGLSYDN